MNRSSLLAATLLCWLQAPCNAFSSVANGYFIPSWSSPALTSPCYYRSNGATSSSSSSLAVALGAAGDGCWRQHGYSNSARNSKGKRAMCMSTTTTATVTPFIAQECLPDRREFLLSQAQALVASDLGVEQPNLLAEEFEYVWNFNNPLDKEEYLKQFKEETKLRTAIPDLFWNAHDFRVDKYDANRVWVTIRMSGQHRGIIKFRGKELEPTYKRIDGAPECITFVFNAAGECVKMTGGYCIDRSVGSTGPVGGLWGIMEALGQPVSSFEYFPSGKVALDVFRRSFRPDTSKPLPRPPLPEALMLGIAKQFITTLDGPVPEASSDLLADSFRYIDPLAGPLKKKDFLNKIGTCKLLDLMPDLLLEYYDFRIDPFDPARVWWTARYKGTNTQAYPAKLRSLGPFSDDKERAATGKPYESAPEASSVTFDKDGFIIKYTSGYVMDPEVGTADGLGGLYGAIESVDGPVPAFRPVPETVRLTVRKLTGGRKIKLAASPVFPAESATAVPPPPPPLPSASGAAPTSTTTTTPAKPAAPAAKAPAAPAVKVMAGKPAVTAKKSPPPPPAKKAAAPAVSAGGRSVVGQKATPPSSSPFGNLFGGGGGGSKAPAAPAKPAATTTSTPTKKATPAVRVPAAKQAATPTSTKATSSSPFGSLFGGGGGNAKASAAPAKPTSTTTSTPVKKAAPPSSSPFGNLFGGGGGGGGGEGSGKAPPAAAKLTVTTTSTPAKKPATQSSSSPFSSFFGGASAKLDATATSPVKPAPPPSKLPPPAAKAAVAPKPTPVPAPVVKPKVAPKSVVKAPAPVPPPSPPPAPRAVVQPKAPVVVAAPAPSQPKLTPSAIAEEGSGGSMFSSMFGQPFRDERAAPAPLPESPSRASASSSSAAKSVGYFKPALLNKLSARFGAAKAIVLEGLTQKYADGEGTAKAFVDKAAAAVGGTKELVKILPDIIAQLPPGARKSDLFSVVASL